MTMLQKIGSQSCGCDAHGQSGLLSIDDALACINSTTQAISGTEEVPLHEAPGRVLVDPVCSLGMVPPFDNAAMDGYALNVNQLEGDGPWELDVADRIVAGHSPQNSLAHNTAAQIFTGAPIPDGANAVVMQEDVLKANSRIQISRRLLPGTHIRTAGEDMRTGEVVVPTGSPLTPRDIAVCAAAGYSNLIVRQRLRVALLVTGDEVCQTDQTRGNASVWDINTPMLRCEILSPAVELFDVQLAADTRSELRNQLADLAGNSDLVVTTGGISVGEEDHVKPALSELEASFAFSGVAIKPGKPVSFGQFNGTHWLGLPGNPLSALVTWRLFGRALVSALTGQNPGRPNRRLVVLSRPLHHKPGRCELRLARLIGFDPLGREVAEFANATHSGRVANLPGMDGLLFVPSEVESLPTGALVEFLTF